jgi:hypothetical protein
MIWDVKFHSYGVTLLVKGVGRLLITLTVDGINVSGEWIRTILKRASLTAVSFFALYSPKAIPGSQLRRTAFSGEARFVREMLSIS